MSSSRLIAAFVLANALLLNNFRNPEEGMSKTAASVYRVEKESTQSLVLELMGDRTQNERLFLILPRPQFDMRFRGPEFVYSESTKTGELQFDVQLPTGLGASGDRDQLRNKYEGLGKVRLLNSVDHISSAKLFIHASDRITYLRLTDLHSNEQLKIKASQNNGLDPEILRTGSPFRVLFLFDLTVDGVKIPIAYDSKLPVSQRIISQ